MTVGRVALVEHPRASSWIHMNDVANAPLSSSLMTGYCAAALKVAGHDVGVVEGNMGGLGSEEVVAAAAALEPDVIGLHLVYDWSDAAHLGRLAASLRASTGAPVLLYGFYPTFAYSELLLSMPDVAGAVLGEPEVTIVEAVAALLRGGGGYAGALSSVAGTASLVGGRVERGPRRPLIEHVDSLPFPARTPEMLALREVNIAGSRGCYGSCTFCTINPFYGHGSRWRPRSPRQVVEEMGAVLEAHPDKGRFYFVDPNFFGPRGRGRGRALELARLIGERFDVRFGIEGRVDDIDDEVIASLVSAGFDEILIGLESGSDATLERLNKRTSVAQNREALRILRSYGVEPNVGFIMFEPHSSLDDVRVNLDFLEEEGLLDRLSVTANVLYHQQILLAGTPAFQAARAAGCLVVSPENPYEGSVPYRHAEVSFLAETMAEACRHVFAALPERVWLEEPGSAAPALDRLRRDLVGTFRGLLEGLATGSAQPDPELAREIVVGVRATAAETAQECAAEHASSGPA